MSVKKARCWKSCLLLGVLCLLSLLTGCWDRSEVNDLAIVVGIGIDSADDEQLELSLLLTIPTGNQGQQSSSGGQQKSNGNQQEIVVSVKGRTIPDAFSKLQEKISRRFFWGHNRVIVFGEELAKEGINEQIDFFVRHPETRLRTLVFVCEGKAADILETPPVLEASRAEMLRELSELKIAMRVTLKDLSEMLSEEQQTAVLPWIETIPLKEEGEEEGYLIRGTAVFKQGKFVGKLNSKQTRGLLWILNKIDMAVITIEPEEEKGFISMLHFRANTTLTPKIINGKPQIIINIVTEDDVLQNETNLELNSKQIQRLEKQTARAIRAYIRSTLENVQKEFNADVLGFSEEFHRKYPKEWKKMKENWDEIFPEIEVKMNIRVEIIRHGMVHEQLAP